MNICSPQQFIFIVENNSVSFYIDWNVYIPYLLLFVYANINLHWKRSSSKASKQLHTSLLCIKSVHNYDFFHQLSYFLVSVWVVQFFLLLLLSYLLFILCWVCVHFYTCDLFQTVKFMLQSNFTVLLLFNSIWSQM